MRYTASEMELVHTIIVILLIIHKLILIVMRTDAVFNFFLNKRNGAVRILTCQGF